MPPTITLHTLLGRPNLVSSGEPQLLYLLVEARPNGAVIQEERLPLNLAVVVDVSSSMRGARLQAVREGLGQILDHLGQEDSFGLVSFNDRASVIIPAQRAAATRPEVRQALDRLEASGGTELAHGLEAGLQEVLRFPRQRSISRILLLTDGRTYGDEARCIELAKAAHRRGIGITAIGLGDEWHEELLEAITANQDSRTRYLADATAVAPVFTEELRRMHATFARNVRLTLAAAHGSQLRTLDRLEPFIMALEPTAETLERWSAKLGDWSGAEPQLLLAELVLPPLLAGEQSLAQLALRYDLPAAGLTDQRCDTLVRTVVQPAGTSVLETDPTVRQWVERLIAVRLQEKAWQELAAGRTEIALERLRMAGTRLLSAGQSGLAAALNAEASRLAQQGQPHEEARKRIRYGTRGLMSDKNP